MKNKGQRTKYTYYRWDAETQKETPITVTVGEDGVTAEHIIFLKEFDHQEQLQERYVKENLDYATENKKGKFYRGDENVVEDPIDGLATNKTNPDFFLYEDEVVDPQVEQLLQLMEKLTPAQIDLIYDHYGARRYFSDIAKEAGCKPQAIDGKKNRIIKRLKKLFAELDKQ
nr:hypothetical protein [uncultured Niameybacter sp.]